MKKILYAIALLMVTLQFMKAQTIQVNCIPPNPVAICNQTTYNVSVQNNTGTLQTFQLRFVLDSRFSNIVFNTLPSGFTVTGGNTLNPIVTITNLSNSQGSVNFSFHANLSCNTIPTGTTTPAIQNTISVTNTNGTAFNSYRVNAQALNTVGSITSPVVFPQIISASSQPLNVSVSPCAGNTNTFTLEYLSSLATFTGAIRINPIVCNNYTITAFRVFRRNSANTINQLVALSPLNPFSLGASHVVSFASFPVNSLELIAIEYDIIQNCAINGNCSGWNGTGNPPFPLSTSCSSTNCLNFNTNLEWGCSPTDICRSAIRVINITPQNPPNPFVSITKITPVNSAALGNTVPWDATCTNTETEWQFLIENRSSNACAIARNVLLDLNNGQIGSNNTFTHIRASSISFTDDNVLLGVNAGTRPNIPAIVVLSGSNTANPQINQLNTTTGDQCLIRNGNTTTNDINISRFRLRVPELLPGQKFILRFRTYRCCPQGLASFNQGVNFNRWLLDLTAQNYCGTNASISTAGYTFNSIPLHNAYVNNIAGVISANLYDAPNRPDFKLVQSIQQATTQLVGTKGGCGSYINFQITNRLFPSDPDQVSDYDLEFFSQCGAPVFGVNFNSGYAGLNPHGQFTFEFDLPPGMVLSTNAPTPTIVGSGITWTASVWNPTANPPTAVFNMASGWTGGSQAGNTDEFRRFIKNSILNFPLRVCCDLPAGANPSPTFNINTYFNPAVTCGGQTQSCNCNIPLSQMPIQLQLLCPGCITPGIALLNYSLLRTNYGFPDIQDDRIADNVTTIINNNYARINEMNRQSSIVGDELQSIAQGFFQEGDNSPGFNYQTWRNYWQAQTGTTPWLSHMYFEQLFKNGQAVGLNINTNNSTVRVFRRDVNNNWQQLGSVVTIPSSRFVIADQGTSDKRMSCYVQDSEFGAGIRFEEGDSFSIITNYSLCKNPTASKTTLSVDAWMYVTKGQSAVNFPFQSWQQAGDVYQNNKQQAINAGTYSPPNSKYLNPYSGNGVNTYFICQGNAGIHYVYRVSSGSSESWTTDNKCTNTGSLTYTSKIDGDYDNIFPYEIKTVPRVNHQNLALGQTINAGALNDLPINFSVKRPNGFRLDVTEIRTRANTWANKLQPFNIMQTAIYASTPNAILQPANPAMGSTNDYRVNAPASTVFDLPNSTLSGLNTTNPPTNQGNPVSQSIIKSGKPALLIGDEYFYESILFNLTAICSTDVTQFPLSPILAADNTIIVPNISDACAAPASPSVLSTTGSSFNVPIPNPNLTSAPGTPVPSGQFIDFPFTLNVPGANISNLIYYIDVPQNEVIPICMSSSAPTTQLNCGTNQLVATNITWQGQNFVRFTVGSLNAGNHQYWLRIRAGNCNNLGSPVSFNIWYSWSCDEIQSQLPPTANLCSAPEAVPFTFTKPNLNVTLTAPGNPTSYTGCTKTNYQACINSSQLGAIGNLTAQITLPTGVTAGQISDAQVTVNGNQQSVFVTNQGNMVTFNLTANLVNYLTTFTPPAAYVGNDGLNAFDGALCLSFNISTTCAIQNIPALNITFRYNHYCDLNTLITQTVQIPARNLGADNCVPSPATVSVNVTTQPNCGSQATLTANPATPTAQSYAWSHPFWGYYGSSRTITASLPGDYTVTVTYPNGCQRTVTTNISPGNSGIIVGSGSMYNATNLTDALTLGMLLPAVQAATTPQTIRVAGTFNINTNYTFASGSQIIALEGAQININSGVTLTLNGTTARGCDKMWRGFNVTGSPIVLFSGGTLNLSNSTIEDTHYAVLISRGSNINISGTTFRNNFIGLAGVNPDPVNMYNNGYGQYGSFIGNTFTSAGSFMKPTYSGITASWGLPLPVAGRQGFAGIYLDNLKNLIVGSPAPAAQNTFSNLANGIISISNNLTVRNTTFANIQSYNYSHSVLGYGIYAKGYDALVINQPAYPATNLSVTGLGSAANSTIAFNNCVYGVYADRINTDITNCRLENISFYGLWAVNNRYGNTSVTNNRLNVNFTGISVGNNDPYYSQIVTDNTITVNGLAPGWNIGYGIYDYETNQVPLNGILSDIRYNNITLQGNSTYGIFANSVTGTRMESNVISILNPTIANGGIYLGGCNNHIIFNNTISSTNPATNSQTTYPIAIQNASSQNGSIICNTMQNIYSGLVFNGPSTGVLYSRNIFVSHTNGLWITNGATVDRQSFNSGTGTKNSMRNEWPSSGSSYLLWAARNDNTVHQWGLQAIYVPTTHLTPPNVYYPSTTKITPSTTWFQPATYNESPTCCINCRPGGEDDELNDFEKTLAKGEAEFAIYEQELKWQNEATLYEKLRNDESIITNDEDAALFYVQKQQSSTEILLNEKDRLHSLDSSHATIDEMYYYQTLKKNILNEIAKSDSIIANATIQTDIDNAVAAMEYQKSQLDLYEQFLRDAQLAFDTDKRVLVDIVKNESDAIIPEVIVAENDKRITSILAATKLKERMYFDDTTQSEIASIAFQCPLKGGAAVYKARSLYAMVKDTFYNDLQVCNEQNMVHFKTDENNAVNSAKSVENASLSVSVYPNPARDYVTVFLSRETDAPLSVTIVESTGKKVKEAVIESRSFSKQLSLSGLSSGFYQLQITNNQTVVGNFKLSIVR